MATEHERIERLRALFAEPSAIGVQVGIGDDCAVLAPTQGPAVWTIDSAVEGVHFRRDRMPLVGIGYRAFMAAASDIAAMGARATCALSALTLPITLGDGELDELAGGIAQAASVCGCPVVGGNLARGGELSITTTVLGEPHSRVLLRSGATAHEGLFVTGPLGGAALGLHALLTERQDPRLEAFTHACMAPRARLDVSKKLAQVATSAIDVSDGLSQDAAHLCRASQLSARIMLERIPRLTGFREVAELLGLDAQRCLAAGGEDYEVLFTAPYETDVTGWATRIGRMQPGMGDLSLVDAAGAIVKLPVAGFDHFR